MKLREFIDVLNNYETSGLSFRVGRRVLSGAYHITEIKNVRVDSVDCGGNRNHWNEVVLQLWLPKGRSRVSAAERRREMSVAKALGIQRQAAALQAFDPEAELLFEFEPEGEPTEILKVIAIESRDGMVEVALGSNPTQCKPATAAPPGGCCG